MTMPSVLGVYVNRILAQYDCTVHDKDFIVDIRDVDINSELIVSYSGASEVEALAVINEEIAGILDDAEIPTQLKFKMDEILFSDMPIKKKRIEIRKLKKYGLEMRFEKMFLNLLEYVKEV